MSRSDHEQRELIEIHAHSLFSHDAAGRMIAINEPRPRPAPRFFLGRTTRGVIWRVRHDLPAGLIDRLAALVADEPIADDLERPLVCLPALRAALAEHGPIGEEYSGPEYYFPDDLGEPGGAVAVTGDNAQVLARWLPDWLPDVAAQLPIMTVLVDGDAVSICASVRLPGQATQAGVETHAAFRGRGHAAIATAAWARTVRDRGVIPLYGTSWTNLGSQRVAAKLGLIRYGASLSID